jgi:hypothetical protein
VYINRTNRPYSYRADGPDGTVTGPYLCTVWVTHCQCMGYGDQHYGKWGRTRALPSTLATSLPTPPPLVNGRDEVSVLRRAGHTGGEGSCGGRDDVAANVVVVVEDGGGCTFHVAIAIDIIAAIIAVVAVVVVAAILAVAVVGR